MKTFKHFIIEGKMSDLDIKKKEYNYILKNKFGITLDDYTDNISGGVADNITIEEILQLSLITLIKGITVELEHTNDPNKALEIALDHLFENPPNSFKYYIGLDKMEKELEI